MSVSRTRWYSDLWPGVMGMHGQLMLAVPSSFMCWMPIPILQICLPSHLWLTCPISFQLEAGDVLVLALRQVGKMLGLGGTFAGVAQVAVAEGADFVDVVADVFHHAGSLLRAGQDVAQ